MLAPLLRKEIFTSDDFDLLETLDMDMYARKIRDKVCYFFKTCHIIIIFVVADFIKYIC